MIQGQAGTVYLHKPGVGSSRERFQATLSGAGRLLFPICSGPEARRPPEKGRGPSGSPERASPLVV